MPVITHSVKVGDTKVEAYALEPDSVIVGLGSGVLVNGDRAELRAMVSVLEAAIEDAERLSDAS